VQVHFNEVFFDLELAWVHYLSYLGFDRLRLRFWCMLAYLRLELVLGHKRYELLAEASELKPYFLLDGRHCFQQPLIDNIQANALQISPDLHVFDPKQIKC